MAAAYYTSDAALSRYGYGGANHNDYGARQATELRAYVPSTLPPPGQYDALLNVSRRRDPRPSASPARHRSRRGGRDRSHSESSQDSTSGAARDPISKAHNVIKATFSNSASGLGVGVLGAIVGGIVAREASESSAQGNGHRHRHRRRSYQDQERTRILSTLLGAAVGGLGANAIEKRIEKSRGKTGDHQEQADGRRRNSQRR